jgi:hypothetical protein
MNDAERLTWPVASPWPDDTTDGMASSRGARRQRTCSCAFAWSTIAAVRTTPRGGTPGAAPPITTANVPDISNAPAAGDQITFVNNTVNIPEKNKNLTLENTTAGTITAFSCWRGKIERRRRIRRCRFLYCTAPCRCR